MLLVVLLCFDCAPQVALHFLPGTALSVLLHQSNRPTNQNDTHATQRNATQRKHNTSTRQKKRRRARRRRRRRAARGRADARRLRRQGGQRRPRVCRLRAPQRRVLRRAPRRGAAAAGRDRGARYFRVVCVLCAVRLAVVTGRGGWGPRWRVVFLRHGLSRPLHAPLPHPRPQTNPLHNPTPIKNTTPSHFTPRPPKCS